MWRFGCLMVIVIFASLDVSAQAIQWTRVYGGASDDFASGVQQTADGGFIVAGTTRSFVLGDSDFYVLRLAPNGDSLWTRTFRGYSGRYDDDCSAIVPARDGGFLLAGSAMSPKAARDMFLIKIDSTGNELWRRFYGTSRDDAALSIASTSDGGYILVGYTENIPPNSRDIFLVKINSGGDTLWTRTLARPGVDGGNSIVQTRDNGYLICGYMTPSIFGQAAFLKTDSVGRPVWQILRSGGEGASATDGVQVSDGGFVTLWVASDPYPSLVLSKFSLSGSEQWTRGLGYFTSARAITLASDAGFVITGVTQREPGSDRQILLIKTRENGDTTWTRRYGGSGNDLGSDVIQTRDGGYLVVGYTTSFGVGGFDVYVMKIAPTGPQIVLTPSLLDFGTLVVPNCKRDSVRVENTGTGRLLISEIRSTNPRFIPNLTSATIQAGMSLWVRVNYCAQFPPGTQSGSLLFSHNGAVVPDAIQLRAQNSVTAVKEEKGMPRLFSLLQNHPNPFNPSTTIEYELPRASVVKLSVYNLLGEEVQMLVSEQQEVGRHQVQFSAEHLPSGVYFYRIQTPDFIASRKMLLLK